MYNGKGLQKRAIFTIVMDNFTICFGWPCLILSGPGSIGYHRCVTPFYRIPMGNFNCVMCLWCTMKKRIFISTFCLANTNEVFNLLSALKCGAMYKKQLPSNLHRLLVVGKMEMNRRLLLRKLFITPIEI